MTPYYTYKTQEKKVFISWKQWPWQPSLRNTQEWSISLSCAALDHQMWLARDFYIILFFLDQVLQIVPLGANAVHTVLRVLFLTVLCIFTVEIMHIILPQDVLFTDITWPVISSGSSAFCLLSQLKYWKSLILQCCCDLLTQLNLTVKSDPWTKNWFRNLFHLKRACGQEQILFFSSSQNRKLTFQNKYHL